MTCQKVQCSVSDVCLVHVSLCLQCPTYQMFLALPLIAKIYHNFLEKNCTWILKLNITFFLKKMMYILIVP